MSLLFLPVSLPLLLYIYIYILYLLLFHCLINVLTIPVRPAFGLDDATTGTSTNITHDGFEVMVIGFDEPIDITNNVNNTAPLLTGTGHVASNIDVDNDIDNYPDDSQDVDNDYSSSSQRRKRSPTNLAPMTPSPSRRPKGRKCCGWLFASSLFVFLYSHCLVIYCFPCTLFLDCFALIFYLFFVWLADCFLTLYNRIFYN